MIDQKSEPNDLINTWQRYDWRESFFAPKIVILQALTIGDKTASGVGRWREAAYQRCLGETAEIDALAQQPEARRKDFHPHRDGLAAHVDPAAARRNAALEAFERLAVSQWWQGQLSADPVSETWLAESGATGMLSIARLGAALKRRTSWWQIRTRPDQPVVMICRSMSPEGQDPVLGFGCGTDPIYAARKALRELYLMEMNLMELLAARLTGAQDSQQPFQRLVSTYTRRCPALLPQRPEVTPTGNRPAFSDSSAETWLGTTVEERDITPLEGPLQVWLCKPDLPVPNFDAQNGVPFA